MKSRLPLLALLLLAAGAGLWFASRRGPAPADVQVVSEPVKKEEPPPAQAVTEAFRLPLPEVPPPTSSDEPPTTPPSPGEPASARALRANPLPPDPLDPEQVEAEELALNIRQYMLRFGANPVGTNAEIVRELNGGNARKARYLPSELLRLNEQGELIDRWGTPYFFHQESATSMEIRSAGPDRRLYTTDDYIAR